MHAGMYKCMVPRLIVKLGRNLHGATVEMLTLENFL